MKSYKWYLLLFILCGISACSDISTDFYIKKEYPSVSRKEPILIFNDGDDLPDSTEVIGTMVSKANKNVYTLEQFFNWFKYDVRSEGGNAIMIMNKKSKYSIFHTYIEAKVLRIHKFDHKDIDFDSLKESWKNSRKSQFEGFYNGYYGEDSVIAQYACLKQTDGDYILYFVDGKTNTIAEPWNCGDIKAFLKKTPNPEIFRSFWYKNNKSVMPFAKVRFNKEKIEVYADDYSDELTLVYPDSAKKDKGAGSGSCFAISENGYFVTCYHVVRKATKIYIKGFNNEFDKNYEAVVDKYDAVNDIAIIKIKENVQSIKQIPYKINNQPKETGDEVFLLGYPLKSEMGTEIKLSKGVVSSSTGFIGDEIDIHVTAPAYPGSSGCPLFDSNGNVIGIVNGGLGNGGRNATFATKANYLSSLIESYKFPVSSSGQNTLSDKTIQEKVKLLKNYIYVVETEQED